VEFCTVLDGGDFSCLSVRTLMFSDYGFELNGDNCTAASWFNASIPITTCKVGATYHNSSGSVIFVTFLKHYSYQ